MNQDFRNDLSYGRRHGNRLTDNVFPARGRGAFTLIELLVVIAIIGVLASMLLPALSRTKKIARGIECMSRIKAFGGFANMYANEYDGYFVSPAYTLQAGQTVSTGTFYPQGSTDWIVFMLMNYYKAPRSFSHAEMSNPAVLPRQIHNAVICPDRNDSPRMNFGINVRAICKWENYTPIEGIYRSGTHKKPSKNAYFIDAQTFYIINLSTATFQTKAHNNTNSVYFIDGHAELRPLKRLPVSEFYPGNNVSDCYFIRAELRPGKTYFSKID